MNGKQLKNSILQWAIQGKLVPQDPNDEPASELLEKIRAEKARLVKEKVVKKSSIKEIPISDDEKLFEIPSTWVWCKLGWVGDWGAGATPAKGNSEFYNNGTIPWLRTGELNNGYVYDSEIKISEKALEKCSLRICKKGDVLIAMYGATIGKVAIAGIELTTNQACCACTPYLIDNKYLLYYLLTSKKAFTELGEGGAQPNISREKIIAFPFALPPLAEQHRIVAKIEELMTLVEKYGAAQEALDEWNQALPEKLKKSILQEAIQGKLVPQDPSDEPASVLLERIREEKKRFIAEKNVKPDKYQSSIYQTEDGHWMEHLEGKKSEDICIDDEIPFDIPSNWKWCRINEYTNKVTDFVASGSFAALRENVRYYKEENYALLVKTKDFQSNFTNDLTYTDEKGYNFLENSNLFGGELILSNVGSIGKIFVVPKLDKKMSLAPNAIMVRLWDDSQRDWLLYLFQSSYGISLLFDISSATAIRKFNKTDFKKLLIPIPPLAEQRRIVAKIEELFGVIKK